MGHPNDKFYIQYLVAFSASLSMFASSAAFAWTAPMLPILQQNDSPIVIQNSEAAWIVFGVALGRTMGVIPSVWSMNRFGRKRTLLIGGIPMVFGWIVCIMATNVEELFAFRALCGLTLGVTHTVVLPMYLGEIGWMAVRGSVSTMHGVMTKLGICCAFAIGPFVTFQQMGWLELVPICVFLMTFVWCPESPYWLLTKGRKDDARASLERLRGHKEVEAEFEQLQTMYQSSMETPTEWHAILLGRNRRRLTVALGLSSGIVFSGSETIFVFANVIFKELNLPWQTSILISLTAAVLLCTTIVSVITVDRFGRRPLLLSSTAGMFVCNVIITLYLFLKNSGINVTSTLWLPATAILAFVACYGLGLATATFAVMGEIIPRNLKVQAGCVFGLTVSSFSMAVLKMFQVMGDSIGYYVMYVLFTLYTALLFPFIWLCIPETKGRTPAEILEMFNR